MKKILFIIIALSISVSAPSKIKFGVKGGGNVSQFSGIDMGDNHGAAGGSTFAYGFHAGGFANYPFSNLFGIQAEALFSMQGGKYLDNIEDTKGSKGTLRANYINIPLLLEIKPFRFPLSFLVGPQFGYCVNRTWSGSESIFIADRYKNFDFAFALGLQFALNEHLTLGLRHNLGVTPSSKFDYTFVLGDQPYSGSAKGEHNRVLHLSASWTF